MPAFILAVTYSPALQGRTADLTNTVAVPIALAACDVPLIHPRGNLALFTPSGRNTPHIGRVPGQCSSGSGGIGLLLRLGTGSALRCSRASRFRKIRANIASKLMTLNQRSRIEFHSRSPRLSDVSTAIPAQWSTGHSTLMESAALRLTHRQSRLSKCREGIY